MTNSSEKWSGETEAACWQACLEAEAELDKLFKEVSELYATPDTAAADKILVEKYDPAIKEAYRKSREAFNQWMEEVRKDVVEE